MRLHHAAGPEGRPILPKASRAAAWPGGGQDAGMTAKAPGRRGNAT